MAKLIKRNTSSLKSSRFWASIDRAAEGMKDAPTWMKAGIDINSNGPKEKVEKEKMMDLNVDAMDLNYSFKDGKLVLELTGEERNGIYPVRLARVSIDLKELKKEMEKINE